jgi:signal peptidase II
MNAVKNIFLIISLIFFDQLSKYMIRHFDGFYICNKGIAFGIELYPVFFWIVWLTIIAVVGFQIFNFKFLGLIFILSGAISNVIDRSYFGCVIDFIDLKIWPVFNLADSFIVIGVILIASSIFRKKQKA